ncbi:MAG: hypothetical protein DMF67_08225 [Acidobacteria bacterium]|nr:MAG: hypothetical protein DMF66_04840 [Acidobacteriota bacterium]PYS83645.1 MAG: hypothetical protein DMF67_08225 [Acidobacteriota bacterium]
MMRTHIQRIALALVVCALLGATALADTKSKNVTFQVDVTVGDTLVKKGSYKVTFDDQAQELKVLKDGKVVAQTTARPGEVKSAGKYRAVYTTLEAADGTTLLSGVDMGGKYAVISSERVAAARSGRDSN